MAALKNHGKELLRIVKVREFAEGPTTWDRETMSFRSDGHILQKHDVKWRSAPSGREFYSYGWAEYKHVRADQAEEVARKAKVAVEGIKSNWRVEFFHVTDDWLEVKR